MAGDDCVRVARHFLRPLLVDSDEYKHPGCNRAQWNGPAQESGPAADDCDGRHGCLRSICRGWLSASFRNSRRLCPRHQHRFCHRNSSLFPFLGKLVLGCFHQRERFLASLARGDMLLPPRHLLQRKIALVVSGQRFRVRTVRLRPAATQMLRERPLEFWIAIVRRHGALPS